MLINYEMGSTTPFAVLLIGTADSAQADEARCLGGAGSADRERLPVAHDDEGGDRQLYRAPRDDRRAVGHAVSDDAVELIHLTSCGLPCSDHNIAWQPLIAAFTEEKGIVDESFTRVAITGTHAAE
ncbi:hypothetical protein [Streptomyces chartreusis]|uniref:hypothetical protein n=1 Tax=Streptomyces chartreusis TaxID=1969 RepID=UPI0033AB7B6A